MSCQRNVNEINKICKFHAILFIFQDHRQLIVLFFSMLFSELAHQLLLTLNTEKQVTKHRLGCRTF